MSSRFQRCLEVCVLVSIMILALGHPSPAGATCWTCPGTWNSFYCQPASVGSWTCTQEYPGAPCMGQAGCPGGGGSDCPPGNNFTTMPAQPEGQTVASALVLFRSRAALNARLFQGRGHALRVVAGGSPGALTVESAASTIAGLSGEGPGAIRLANAFTNLNGGAKSVTFQTNGGDGWSFATASGPGSVRLQLKGAHDRDIMDANVGPNDLVLVDLQIGNEAFVLAMKLQSLDIGAADLGSRIQRFQDAIRHSVENSPGAEPLTIIIPIC